MSDQDDWEFAGPDDAKAEIRAAASSSRSALRAARSALLIGWGGPPGILVTSSPPAHLDEADARPSSVG